jgi:D-serine deaminase-like pyridoxal phosphate-dependent protein
MRTLHELETPALLLDRDVLDRNLARMGARMKELGARLRPHVKTVKSLDVVRRALGSPSDGITVSTLKEADYFAGAGITDILYGVGIAPGKLHHVIDLIRRGVSLTIAIDNIAALEGVAAAGASAGIAIPLVIELDVDGHRSGVAPTSDLLLELAKAALRHKGVKLRGVMTHAGGSYDCTSTAAIRDMAERERSGAVHAAGLLRELGVAVDMVSVGSTPTATFASRLDGVTEVRAGVYMVHDLVMMNLGVCELGDIALSTLVSVIGHQPDRGWVITDGGWMALSRDRGTARQGIDQGYGLVRDVRGEALPDDLIVHSANQEHGIIARRDGKLVDPARYPVGQLLRVLPNHACAMAAQHSSYEVVCGKAPEIVATWSRIKGC